jgi:RNA polymerase sigma factor (sigma-70 family)
MSRKVDTIPLNRTQQDFATTIYQQYGPLIRKIARELSNRDSAVDDLYSIAILGVIRALAKDNNLNGQSPNSQRNIICAIARRSILDALDSENALKRKSSSMTLSLAGDRELCDNALASLALKRLSAASPVEDRIADLLESRLLDQRDKSILTSYLEAERLGVDNKSDYVCSKLRIAPKTYAKCMKAIRAMLTNTCDEQQRKAA